MANNLVSLMNMRMGTCHARHDSTYVRTFLLPVMLIQAYLESLKIRIHCRVRQSITRHPLRHHWTCGGRSLCVRRDAFLDKAHVALGESSICPELVRQYYSQATTRKKIARQQVTQPAVDGIKRQPEVRFLFLAYRHSD
jgi:hypothetical protein